MEKHAKMHQFQKFKYFKSIPTHPCQFPCWNIQHWTADLHCPFLPHTARWMSQKRDNPSIHIWVLNMLTIKKKIIYIQSKYNNESNNWIFVKTCKHHTRPVCDLICTKYLWYDNRTIQQLPGIEKQSKYMCVVYLYNYHNLKIKVIFNIIYMSHVFCYKALWYFGIRFYNTQNVLRQKTRYL